MIVYFYCSFYIENIFFPDFERPFENVNLIFIDTAYLAFRDSRLHMFLIIKQMAKDLNVDVLNLNDLYKYYFDICPRELIDIISRGVAATV